MKSKRICRATAKRLGRRIADTAQEVVFLGGEDLMTPFRTSELLARVIRWENQIHAQRRKRA